MNYDLYFISIIEKALENKLNRKQALVKAFEEIERLGRQDSYKVGYRQFCKFMRQIDFSKQEFSPQWLEKKLTEYFGRPKNLTIAIEKDGVLLETLRFPFSGGTQTLKEVTHGYYRIILDTGICIGSAHLTKTDLIFSEGAGGDRLKMAADSDERGPEPVRTESFFDGMIKLCVYAGFKNGTIEITVKNIRV